MSYIQVLLPTAVAEDFADAMARENCMQFTDLNEDFQPFQRQYTGDIIKIQEIERQIKSIEEQLDEYKIQRSSDVTIEDIESVERPSNASQIVESISKEVGDAYTSLQDQSQAEKQLKHELTSQQDSIRVLRRIDTFLQSENEAQQMLEEKREQKAELEAELQREQQHDARRGANVPLLEMNGNASGAGIIFGDNRQRDVGFKYFAGVVTIGQRVSFERQIFLTSRGNSFVQFDENDDTSDKIAFVVFFLGDELKRSLKRLCQFMNIQICYESDDERTRDELLDEAEKKRDDFTRIHSATENQLHREHYNVSKKLKGWKVALMQEKSIRITLNKFRSGQGNVLRAEGWIPVSSREMIENILDKVTANKGVGNAVITPSKPKGVIPTAFELNDFTRAFQQIVDTYGVPRYQEFNPAVPTCITFPFLFGVMYGDMFHASFLLIFASTLCFGGEFIYGNAIKPSGSLAGMYGARWVLFLMGFFALYCGLIYNDVMSISFSGFNGTQWGSYDEGGSVYLVQSDGVYHFGIDPSWHGVSNQLTYENSLKMKLSVIIGVSQMTFGLFLKLSNHIYENDWISVFCEFVPQLVFMTSFFIYMIFLIIYKWCINWVDSDLYATPSLITVLIKMILSPFSLPESTELYDANTQHIIQLTFVLLMILSIPWMLIPKPFLLKAKHNQRMVQRALNNGNDDLEMNIQQQKQIKGYSGLQDEEDDNDMDDEKKQDSGGHGHGHGDDDEEFEFSEVMIHQIIHTIEYVLGTISNTASYLRLWALSLAHAELADVFYSKILETTLSGTGVGYVLLNVGGVYVFLLVTFGVLMVMDILECFLHALRLHWVEFQNKFYYADGVAFQPFSYRKALEDD